MVKYGITVSQKIVSREEKVLGSVGMPEELYNKLEESFSERLPPQRGGEDYLVDLSWAVRMLESGGGNDVE